MDIYEKLNKTVSCHDLFEFSDALADFSECALREKNKATLVKLFYERLAENTLIDYAVDDIINSDGQNYIIYDNKKAIGKYIAFAKPQQTTPVKTLKDLIVFSREIRTCFTTPVGKSLTKNKVIQIMNFLDAKYNFSKKVFSSHKAIFALVGYSHKKYNSECLIIKSDTEVFQHLFLYHMNGSDHKITPEAVLFHELGHTLHAKYAGGIETVPQNILDLLKNLCMPTIDTLTAASQSEVFADILSVGMMFNSPFENFDPFDYMHKDDKKAFNQLFEKLLSVL